MGARIEVLNTSGQPRANYGVSVEWTDGRSNGRTDSNGIYDTGTSGTIKSVSVEGRTVYSSGGRRVTDRDIVNVTY